MEAAFLYLQERAVGSGIVIAVVIALRYLLRDAPKAFRMILWAVVAVRLLCPYVPESPWGVIPESQWDFTAETSSEALQTPDALPDTAIVMTPLNPAELYPVPARTSPETPQISPIRILSGVWLCGLCGLLAWSLYSYIKLRRTVAASLPVGDNTRICDDIETPFVLGILRPRIYVPSGLTESALASVLAHETAHIRRGDTLWKLCAWLITCLYWHHPLVWLSYSLFCRDMELACDEAVIRDMDASRRAAYSEALLQCGLRRRRLQVCPLAFGETGVKERVKAALNYRKPALWLTGAAVCACVIAAVCLLTRPASAESDATETQANTATETLSDADAVTETLSDAASATNAATQSDAASVKGADAASATQSGKEPLEWVTVNADANWENLEETRESVEYPGVTFHWTPEKITMTDADGAETVLYYGMPVWNAYFSDLNGDGYSELCSMVSMGSGLIDERIEVYDIRNGRLSELQDRGYVNYTLSAENGALIAKQWRMDWYVLPYSAPLLTGTLRLTDAGKLLIVPSNPDAIGAAQSVGYGLSPELESAVHDAILTHDRDRYADADFDAESHVLLGIFPDAVETEADSGEWENIITLYLMTLFNGYDYRDGRFETVTGRSGPAVLTFRMGADGESPTLTDYWEPRDGSYYWPDVREKFPSVLTDAELNTQTYIMQETQDCYRQAVERWNMDVTPILDALFDTIMESPATSSNPGDYLDEHPLEVRELLYYGGYTRAYIDGRIDDAQGLLARLMELVSVRLEALTWNQPGAVADLSGLSRLVHATLTHTQAHTGPEPGTYALSDAEKLSALRDLLSGATSQNPTKCPFDDILTLTDESGVTLQLALAGDSCGAYRFAGRCYRYGGDDTALYALFA